MQKFDFVFVKKLGLSFFDIKGSLPQITWADQWPVKLLHKKASLPGIFLFLLLRISHSNSSMIGCTDHSLFFLSMQELCMLNIRKKRGQKKGHGTENKFTDHSKSNQNKKNSNDPRTKSWSNATLISGQTKTTATCKGPLPSFLLNMVSDLFHPLFFVLNFLSCPKNLSVTGKKNKNLFSLKTTKKPVLNLQ